MQIVPFSTVRDSNVVLFLFICLRIANRTNSNLLALKRDCASIQYYSVVDLQLPMLHVDHVCLRMCASVNSRKEGKQTPLDNIWMSGVFNDKATITI